MTYRVPFVDPKSHYQKLKPEIDRAIIDCLWSGNLIDRGQLRDFEARLAAFVGVKYAVGLNSGYHALHFSLQAAGVGPGDEVITVAHTFVATVPRSSMLARVPCSLRSAKITTWTRMPSKPQSPLEQKP